MNLVLVFSMLRSVAAQCEASNAACNRCDNAFVCQLCDVTAPQLAGHITWVVGGGSVTGAAGDAVIAPVCNESKASNSDRVWTLYSGAVVKGNSDYKLHGTLRVSGTNVVIEDVQTTSAVELVADSVAGTKIKNVVTDDVVGVRGYRASATGPLLDMQDVVITNVYSTQSAVGVALAHTTNSNFDVVCSQHGYKLVLQPATPLDQYTATNCYALDLSAVLNEFGRPYEVQMFNPDAKPTSPTLTLLVRILVGIDVVLLVSLLLCFRGSADMPFKPKKD